MAKAYVFLVDELEEVECLVVVDVFHHSSVEVTLASVAGGRKAADSRRIELGTNALFDDVDPGATDVLLLPGRTPEANDLKAHKGLRAAVECANKQGKRIAAICATPSILENMGLLKGGTATCYSGFEGQLTGMPYTSQGVMTDGNITTGRGLRFALDMGLEPIHLLRDSQQVQETAAAIQYSRK